MRGSDRRAVERFIHDRPERGLSRGVAVSGNGDINGRVAHLQPSELLDLLESLCAIRPTQDLATVQPLSELVSVLQGSWSDTSESLYVQIGFFVGNGIVHDMESASWHVWPNGRPVIRLHDGRFFDVIEFSRTSVEDEQVSLLSVPSYFQVDN